MTLTYQKSGVNYSLMDPFKNACLKAGGNASTLLEFPDFYLTDINEGLGSLNKLADQVYIKSGRDFYYQIGWGNAASILNDLAILGANPLTLKLFVAVGSEEWFTAQKRWQSLIRGFKAAADYCGAKWNGGETQTLVDLIDPGSCVLGGSAVGIIQPKTKLLTEDKLTVGDRVILLSSSGVHTNGATLIRQIFKNNPTLGIEALKDKTVLYSPLVNKLLEQNVNIHYASHITGHGWRKIMRSKRQFTYILEKIPKVQPIFCKIQQKTKMSDAQMYGDYNMGAGLALFVPPKEVDQVLKIAQKESIQALNAGFLEEGPRQVIIKPLGVIFKDSSLQIR